MYIRRQLKTLHVPMAFFVRLALLAQFGLGCLSPASGEVQKPVFRFSLSTEPSHFDPARITSSESNYFIVNLLRGLYVLDGKGEVKPEIADSCKERTPLKFECVIRKNAKWSDGKEITAEDFVKSWGRLLQPGAKGVGVNILANVKYAFEIHKGLRPMADLGVKAKSKRQLEILLNTSDSDFLAKLAHPALSVVRSEFSYSRSEESRSTPVSGPYKISDWSKSNRIRLESNAHFDSIRPGLHQARPGVEVLIVDDDETAFNLYREGTLTFLRRLPSHYLKDWSKSNELHQIPVVRFDYIGFGPALHDQPDLRKALALSLNYQELKVLYSALGIPGCPGISPDWMNQVPCHKFDLEKAKSHFARVSPELKNTVLKFQFSKLGGDDIQKGMEWAQAQWKKNLGFNVTLQPVEQSVFVAGLKSDPPPIFRKGVGLDRASCLAATEIFTVGDGENYIRLDSQLYHSKVRLLATSRTNSSRREYCTELVQILINDALIVPLGRIHFSLLSKPTFAGWTLTPLNQLDLSHLHISK